MSDTLIAAGLRAVLAAALPGYADRTERPAAVAEEGLPAFALVLDREGAEPLAMGDPREFVTATVTIGAFVRGADPRTAASAARDAVAAAIRGAGNLGGLVFSAPVLTGSQIEVGPGQGPLGQAILRYSLRFIA